MTIFYVSSAFMIGSYFGQYLGRIQQMEIVNKIMARKEKWLHTGVWEE